MKVDMHCHTKEGSLDGKVTIEEYIRQLIIRGIDGMVVTDHNSYDGYRAWQQHLKDRRFPDFTVLRGIEYDTCDAGHMLVIMPSGVWLPVLEKRGMKVAQLIYTVHRYGGILGPAHPCGEPYLSMVSTLRQASTDQLKALFQRFDFVEVFNSCEDMENNENARLWAEECGLPQTAGSDAHKADCIGLACTEMPDDIRSEDDLIRYVREGGSFSWSGVCYRKTLKDRLGKWNNALVAGYYFYNKLAGVSRVLSRRSELRDLGIPVRGIHKMARRLAHR